MTVEKISIIGSGWVGTALGKGLAELGNEVIFYDVVDKDLLNFTKDISYAIENSDVSFISVPTPTTSEGIDLSYIKEATKSIGNVLATKKKLSPRSSKKHRSSRNNGRSSDFNIRETFRGKSW